MENIDPVAKQLAEINGIDWHIIKGTGPGGQIIDQDIVNYLTRVMTGEEAPPETPVDLPPPDWNPDEELPVGVTADMLSKAGVDSDLAAAVSQGIPKPEIPKVKEEPKDFPSFTSPATSTPVKEEPKDFPSFTSPATSTPVKEEPKDFPQDSTTNQTAVSFGTYLRRDVDLSEIVKIREQLNKVLDQDVPVSLLITRAAQRYLDIIGKNTIAIKDVHGNAQRSVGEKGCSLRESLKALDTEFPKKADVLVVSAATFDLDELHYSEAITLSIGRIHANNMAALSINGNIDTEKAAKFLAGIADILEIPVAIII